MPGVGPTRVVALYSAAFGGIAGPESILVTLPPLSSDIDAEYVELHADLIVSPVADIGTVTFRWRANDVNGDQFGADFTLSQADMAAGGELSVSVSAVAVGANFAGVQFVLTASGTDAFAGTQVSTYAGTARAGAAGTVMVS